MVGWSQVGSLRRRVRPALPVVPAALRKNAGIIGAASLVGWLATEGCELGPGALRHADLEDRALVVVLLLDHVSDPVCRGNEIAPVVGDLEGEGDHRLLQELADPAQHLVEPDARPGPRSALRRGRGWRGAALAISDMASTLLITISSGCEPASISTSTSLTAAS